ncbi:MAG: trigger factor, partial [Schaalia hyovaginalis]|nr:trigger factor [Schaalia hyovaginalis]
FGLDINKLFSSSQQMASVVADLGRAKALIEALRKVTVKDEAGAVIDLAPFFGDVPAEDGEAEDASADEAEGGEEA